MSTVEDETHDGPGHDSSSDGEEHGELIEVAGISPPGETAKEHGPGEGLGSPNGASFNGYSKRLYNLQREGIDSPPSFRDGAERPSSAEGSSSIPDDTPSPRGSLASSPNRRSRVGSYSRSPTHSLRGFDRRFQTRLSSSQLGTPRAASPAFLTPHSRNSSAAWTLQDGEITETEVPWEVVRWTKLKKMTGQAFSEIGKRNFGRPTCVAVSASIVLGTSKGIILLFDYHQNLKSVIGPGTKAIEAGAVTSVSISADHTTVAGGHASGSIFTWELAKPGKPFLHISTIDKSRNPNIDGHLPDAAVLHLGFLGIRHTALSSADDKGMAFSHLATRGMGVVARTVKTTRILGRYPDNTSATSSRKPSSVLSFSPLPLGNTAYAADTMGLVAMLTPYLLVIVSTMPIAQTQFKSPRPKEVASHSAMTGALAWFPSVKLKASDPGATESASQAKLVYCWSNVLTILDVIEVEPSEVSSKSEPPSLQFKPRSRWKAEEPIVGVQWISRSVLAVLTITQQLVILEDYSMLVTDSSDLLHKHVYHRDLFSTQLNQLVDRLDDEEVGSMHGVVADAFYMSFRAYKGRLFLLGHSEVSFGTLSNWADRLHALIEEGSYIRAIELATGYYTGEGDKVTVGLPKEDESRHKLVREKLLDIMLASVKYAIGQGSTTISSSERRKHLDELARLCKNACIHLQDLDYLYDEIYPLYQENHVASIFLENLESSVKAADIKVLPPEVIKDLVNHYTSEGLSSRLEEVLCRLDPRTMDVDQVTSLCKANHLYDALLYVWNQALGDYTTILSELLQLGLPQQNGNLDDNDHVQQAANASKVFPYLSYILTGRTYPTGVEMADDQANLAKADIYSFFFSGRGSDGPPRGDISPQPSCFGPRTNFPNLRRALDLDASSFLSMLNEAFEDSFLNGPQERFGDETPGGLTEAQKSGLCVNRQCVVSILLKVMTPAAYKPIDIVYLDMFIARNLPKFPQFIVLPGHTLQKVLIGLCKYPTDEVVEDCQLSVEYLLSLYQPPDLRSLIPTLQEARFYRVLKSVFKNEKQYARVLRTCFEDEEHLDEVYDCIADCLRPGAGLNERQAEEVRAVIVEHAGDLVSLDVTRAATTINEFAPDLHDAVLATLEGDGSRQYHYLQIVLEPTTSGSGEEPVAKVPQIFIEQYVRLMCEYDPSHVSIYVDELKTGDLRLEEVLPAFEDGGVVDAAVVLLAREGKVREGINRFTKHMQTLEAALLGLMEGSSEDVDERLATAECDDLIGSVQKFSRVGVWICQGHTRKVALNKPPITRKKSSATLENQLPADEELWLNLIDSVVRVVKNTTEILERLRRRQEGHGNQSNTADPLRHITFLRNIVQETFTALLNTTTAPRKDVSRRTDLSFLRILRAFLTRASLSSPSLSNLRGVLSAIFSAYSYEEELLSLSNKLLDKDLFVHVTEADMLRRRGWRPLGQVCEGCSKRVWGPGAGSQIWEEFQQSKERRSAIGQPAKETGDKPASRAANASQCTEKGKAVTRDGEGDTPIPQATASSVRVVEPGSGPIVVFACRHMFHRSCLERMRGTGDEGGDEQHRGRRAGADLACPLCI